MNTFSSRVSRNSDLALVAGIFCILLVLLTPIPTYALDFLIICNFSFALLLLLLTFYTEKPTDFSTFPAMLLIATLFRLSLNVAATRLILSQGDAGHVINAIGQHVVGGNYVIGIIVFLILIVVQYIVVTAGAQRVAEVAARFTLDSMPGRQMSIDADLNMGFIDQEVAQSRRKLLEKEANFYGAMDGASKFVKGDAIAGLVILFIDIVGGFAIGVWQLGMPWAEALQRFTLLTIGDGIVTQVPALVISIGTGIIVTRSVGDGRLSSEIIRQLISYPRTLVLIGIVLCAMLFLPGLPVWPIIILLIGLALCFPLIMKRSKAMKASEVVDTEIEHGLLDGLILNPIEVLVGAEIPNISVNFDQDISLKFKTLRQQVAHDIGMVVPEIVLKMDSNAVVNSYQIMINGIRIGQGELMGNNWLAIASGQQKQALEGISVKDPAYGLPAIWIEENLCATAESQGYTIADPITVFMTHFGDLVRKNLSQLLSRAETERMVNRIRLTQPSLVEELLPNILTLSDIQRVMQGLLQEGVPIRHVEQILEVLVDQGRQQKDPLILIEKVRQRLSSVIYQSLLGFEDELQVVTLEPAAELAVVESLRNNNSATSVLVLEPRLAEQLILKLSEYAERVIVTGSKPVLLCQPEVRRGLRTFLERVIPHLTILSITELPSHAKVRANGTIQLALNK